MNIETAVLTLFLVFFAATSIAGALFSRHLLKLVFYLSSLTDAVLVFTAVFAGSIKCGLQSAADLFLAVSVIIKFSLSLLLIFASKSHENENPSLNKDYRPKSYD